MGLLVGSIAASKVHAPAVVEKLFPALAGLNTRQAPEKLGGHTGVRAHGACEDSTNTRLALNPVAAAARIRDANFAVCAFRAEIARRPARTVVFHRRRADAPGLAVDLEAIATVVTAGGRIIVETGLGIAVRRGLRGFRDRGGHGNCHGGRGRLDGAGGDG